MAITNRDRVHRALDLLLEGLRPYVEREMEAEYGPKWRNTAVDILREQKEWIAQNGPDVIHSHSIFQLCGSLYRHETRRIGIGVHVRLPWSSPHNFRHRQRLAS